MAARNNWKKEFDYCFKVVLLGEFKVGKTSLLFRYTEDCFDNSLKSTVGVDFRMKTFYRNDKQVKLQIWDTGGIERFRSQSFSFYRGVKGVILVYDITNRHSFDSLGYWIEEIHRNCIPHDPCVILIGNKCHLDQFREVLTEEGEQYAGSHNMPFYETSAENNVNVTECFEHLVTQMIAVEELSRIASDLGIVSNSFELAPKNVNARNEEATCKCL